MKYLIAVTLSTTVLVGCGGGSSNSVSTPSTSPSTTTPNNAVPNVVITPSTTGPAYDLVIDNGRGIINNQDTESPE